MMTRYVLPARIAATAISIVVCGAAMAQGPVSVQLLPENLGYGAAMATPDASGMGLRIKFEKAAYPSVQFRAPKAYASPDLSAMGGIAVAVHNPNNTPLTVFLRADDSPEADGNRHCRTGSATLAPDETATLILALSGDVQGMKAGPPLVTHAEKPKQLSVYGDTLNPKNIITFQIFLAGPDRAYDLDLRSIRFIPRPDMNGVVDRWGQYAHDDWPGKVKDDADLTRQTDEEAVWLKAHPPLAGRDEYGGWQAGPTLKRTGFFRTALVVNGKEVVAPKPGVALPSGARWWLVTPGGHLFWSAGVDCVRPYAESPLAGRESLFADLPDGAKQRGQADFYFANLQRKNGTGKAWIDSTVARFRSWGFNTIGNWSDSEIEQAHRIPYTVPLGVGDLPRLGNNPLSDYFDPSFPEKARVACREQAKATKDDPWCLGYFIDNELAWDTWAQMGTGGEYVVARDAIAAPEAQPARRAFVALLKERYATPSLWAKAWGIAVSDWNTPVTIAVRDLNPASKADCAAFSTRLAHRYFSVMRDAIKAVAPRQLYLGCRFAIRPPEIVAVAARYCDVVSFNIYEDAVTQPTWGFTEQLGKPVIIGEYHFGATDRGLFSPGLRERPDQASRAQAFETYVKSVRARPAFVGCHWFQWIDEPLVGRFDGENHNIGFLTVTDLPYPEMRDAARRAHATLYKP